MRSSALVLGTALVAGLTSACQQPAAAPAPAVGPPTAAPVAPAPAVGAVFLGGTDTHVCTATVLRSRTADLILTAAHCLAADYPAIFVPGFDGHTEPGEAWTVDTVYLDPRWLATRDPVADYAFARVSRPGAGTLETATGASMALGTAPAGGTTVTVTGYPLGVGGGPIGCRGVTGVTPGGFPSLPCGGLVDGTSGAPWAVGETVVGLVGGLDGGGCDDAVSYSPPFTGQAAALLARAETGGPGDVAPEAFDPQC